MQKNQSNFFLIIVKKIKLKMHKLKSNKKSNQFFTIKIPIKKSCLEDFYQNFKMFQNF